VLLGASFAILNNCTHHSQTAALPSDPSSNVVENAPSAEFFAPAYPPSIGGLPLQFIETACFDGVDNDGDGLTDCWDNDCHIHAECSQWGPPLENIVNSDALTIFPNGLLLPEIVAFENERAAYDDDENFFPHNPMFDRDLKDCWIVPIEQDPYYNVPLGEALIAGPDGPIGPQLDPAIALRFFGPRAGLINECGWGNDLMFWHIDDDDWDDDNDDDSDDEEDDRNFDR